MEPWGAEVIHKVAVTRESFTRDGEWRFERAFYLWTFVDQIFRLWKAETNPGHNPNLHINFRGRYANISMRRRWQDRYQDWANYTIGLEPDGKFICDIPSSWECTPEMLRECPTFSSTFFLYVKERKLTCLLHHPEAAPQPAQDQSKILILETKYTDSVRENEGQLDELFLSLTAKDWKEMCHE